MNLPLTPDTDEEIAHLLARAQRRGEFSSAGQRLEGSRWAEIIVAYETAVAKYKAAIQAAAFWQAEVARIERWYAEHPECTMRPAGMTKPQP